MTLDPYKTSGSSPPGDETETDNLDTQTLFAARVLGLFQEMDLGANDALNALTHALGCFVASAEGVDQRIDDVDRLAALRDTIGHAVRDAVLDAVREFRAPPAADVN